MSRSGGWLSTRISAVQSGYQDKEIQITTDYTLKGHTLTTEDYTKYLGVELQSTFSWNRHIDQTVKKANNMVGLLPQNLRVSSEATKTSAYYSMVRPLLEYCSTVWSPYTKEYIWKIEMVQRRAARYVTNRYHNTSNVTSMLDHLEWETLESRRTKNQLIMFFKIVHGLVDIPADKYLTPAFTQTPSHHSLKYKFPLPVSTASFLKQFVSGIPFQPQWLRLPLWYLSKELSTVSFQTMQARTDVSKT